MKNEEQKVTWLDWLKGVLFAIVFLTIGAGAIYKYYLTIKLLEKLNK